MAHNHFHLQPNITQRPNILVICGRNKRRSRTAEYIFKNDSRFNIRSVGLSPKSNRQLSEKDILWANLIFVMETGQRGRLTGVFRHLILPKIEILDIEDNYEYLDDELIELLTHRINSTLKIKYRTDFRKQQ
jgi:protein-tyrosine phosphatase